jgi:hypothetical protein
MAPDKNGWAAAIIFTCACQAIERVPPRGWKAQSNTGKCSSSKSGEPSIVSCSAMYSMMELICSAS